MIAMIRPRPSRCTGGVAEVSSARGKTAWVADLVAAGCCTALIVCVLLALGGIWEHVNTGDLHALCIPWYQYSARGAYLSVRTRRQAPIGAQISSPRPQTQGAVLAKF